MKININIVGAELAHIFLDIQQYDSWPQYISAYSKTTYYLMCLLLILF